MTEDLKTKADKKREKMLKALIDEAILEVKKVSDEDMVNRPVHLKLKLKVF